MSEPPLSISHRASRGVAWLSFQTVTNKLIYFVAQLLLANLLLEEDFGLFGLAFTIHSLAGLLHQGGVQDVLVKRHHLFARWANVGFWMSAATGLAAGLLMVAGAPLAALFFRTERPDQLIWMIVILAINLPLSALGAVSRAQLQIEMRFRAIALTGMLRIFLDGVFKVVLALLGFGAFSFVLGIVLVGFIHLVLCWWLAPPPIRWDPQFRRWKYLFGDGMMVIIAGFFYWMITQGDYLVLGRFYAEDVVGIYFFAFTFSQHTITLFTFHVSRVLFPALSHLPDEVDRRINAFVRASRMLALIAIPVCIGQAAVAAPLVHLFFAPRWYAAIPLIQVMCLGMSLRSVSTLAVSLLQAQGRFRTRMLLSGISAGVFFPVAVLGTWLGGALGLAIAVACFFSCFALIDLAVAVAPGRRIVSNLAHIYVLPVGASVLAIGTAWGIAGTFVDVRAGKSADVLYLVLIVAISVPLYAMLVRQLAPPLWRDTWERLSALSPASLRALLQRLRWATGGRQA